MEALNKESEFAAPVLTWAQKRSDLREKSTVGKFVRSSLQGLNHEDVLLKLETKIINNGKGHARASAHGLRAIMETMLHGSQFYMLFKEAFHIYGSFFETNKDEEAFRDILLHPETELNVVTVTHPVTLKRFVVLNNPLCDVSMFLNHFTQEFSSGDENADQLRLDQETVSALLKSMDTSMTGILRAIIALLHTQSETVNLGIEPTLACEAQTHFRSSLLSLRKIASANPSGKTISVT